MLNILGAGWRQLWSRGMSSRDGEGTRSSRSCRDGAEAGAPTLPPVRPFGVFGALNPPGQCSFPQALPDRLDTALGHRLGFWGALCRACSWVWMLLAGPFQLRTFCEMSKAVHRGWSDYLSPILYTDNLDPSGQCIICGCFSVTIAQPLRHCLGGCCGVPPHPGMGF